MHQDLDEAIDDVTKAGGKHPVDRTDMWRELWRKAVDHDKFWQTEFIDKAVLVRLKLKEMGEVVDGDAPVEGPTSSSLMADAANCAVVLDAASSCDTVVCANVFSCSMYCSAFAICSASFVRLTSTSRPADLMRASCSAFSASTDIRTCSSCA